MKYNIEIREDNAGYLFLCIQVSEKKWLVFDELERCRAGSANTILEEQTINDIVEYGDATEITVRSRLDGYGTCVCSNGEKDINAMGPAARRFFAIVE